MFVAALALGVASQLFRADSARLPKQAVPALLDAPLSDAQSLAVMRGEGDLPLSDLSHYQPRHSTRSAEAKLNGSGCEDNTEFAFGVGVGDITGPSFDVVMLGYADSKQVAQGIHDRQYARAFAFQSTCGGRTGRAMIVQMDIGLMFNSIKQGVVERVARDPALKGLYAVDNILLNASHSHGTAGGQAFHDLTNLAGSGHDPDSYEAAVRGVVAAISRAHDNMVSAESGQLLFNQAELLNGNVNRSRASYLQNAESERAAFVDTRGREVDTNRMMVLVKLLRAGGTAAGLLNWYPVHGTSVSQLNRLLTGDNKGYAAQRFERAHAEQTSGSLTPTDLRERTFAAGFLQADEGDASPNLFITEVSDADLRDLQSEGFRKRGGGRSELENAVISGTKQYQKARDLFDTAREPLRGEVAAVHQLLDFARVEVAKTRVYPTKWMPQGSARTCMGALGPSLGGGAEDGRGPSIEGQTCFALRDLSGIAKDIGKNLCLVPDGIIPPGLFVPLGCWNPVYDWLGYDCHAEKPILLPLGMSPFDTSQGLAAMTIPLQIVTLGNLAIIALPWEVTTMAGRRLRNVVLEVLADAGVDYAVIAGLSNDYIHYLTTREEYALQHYEGASTVFGPFTGEAAEQELSRLATSLRMRTPPRSPYADDAFRSHRTSYLHEADRGDGTGEPGRVLVAPLERYTLQPDRTVVVEVRFAAGNPRHDLRQDASYVYIERQDGPVATVVATDTDWSTRFTYGADDDGARQAIVHWLLEPGTAPGRYRVRHEASSAQGPYSVSTPFFEVRAP